MPKGKTEKMKTCIEYLNKDDNFKRTKKHFENYEEAATWGRANLENFNLDMINCDSDFTEVGNMTEEEFKTFYQNKL